MSNYYPNPNSYQYGPYDGDGMPMNVPPMPLMGKPDNHMVLAVISTFFGFVPLGIAAIIVASKTDSLWAMGDVQGAWNASEKARKISIWALLLLPALTAFITLFFMAAVLLGM